MRWSSIIAGNLQIESFRLKTLRQNIRNIELNKRKKNQGIRHRRTSDSKRENANIMTHYRKLGRGPEG